MALYACCPPAHLILRPHSGALCLVLLAVAAALLLLPQPAAAHGFLAEPSARNVERDWQSCPHCLNYGGTWPSSNEGRLRWPDTAQPVRRALTCGAASMPLTLFSCPLRPAPRRHAGLRRA